MSESKYELDPYLLRQVKAGLDGADIIHGWLKVKMLDAQHELLRAQEDEEKSGEAMDSMERKYWEGIDETLSEVYALTYAIAFAKEEANGSDSNNK